MSISVHICFTLATGCAYALYIYMYICIYVCVDVYVCMYISLYVCVPFFMYMRICMDVYICVCVCVCACVCVYTYIYMYVCAWRGGLFLTEGKIVVLSVSSLFLTRVGVYVCVSVCIRTHTHTLHRCSDVSPGVGMRHLECPKNPDGLNLDIHIFVYVYKAHMCIYMLRGGMRSWTDDPLFTRYARYSTIDILEDIN